MSKRSLLSKPNLEDKRKRMNQEQINGASEDQNFKNGSRECDNTELSKKQSEMSNDMTLIGHRVEGNLNIDSKKSIQDENEDKLQTCDSCSNKTENQCSNEDSTSKLSSFVTNQDLEEGETTMNGSKEMNNAEINMSHSENSTKQNAVGVNNDLYEKDNEAIVEENAAVPNSQDTLPYSIDIDPESQEAGMFDEASPKSEETDDDCSKSIEQTSGEKPSTSISSLDENTEVGVKSTRMNAFDILMGRVRNKEQRSHGAKKQKSHNSVQRNRSSWCDRDTEEYRKGYPGKKDRKSTMNLKFYKNEVSSHPEGDFIDNIHKKWWGNYDLLERHHGFIQWLFPIRECGMNFSAYELTLDEAKKIREKKETSGRFLKSYTMMLDFYGIRLVNEETGEVDRAVNWKSRFQHLNRSYHNYLRITRILKCLGEMGLEHYKYPLILFLIHESLEEKTLYNAAKSCKDYWVHILRNDEERDNLVDYINELEATRQAKVSSEKSNYPEKKKKGKGFFSSFFK